MPRGPTTQKTATKQPRNLRLEDQKHFGRTKELGDQKTWQLKGLSPKYVYSLNIEVEVEHKIRTFVVG